MTGDRHDVLGKDAPEWQAAVVAADCEAGRPLRAVKIGAAGKYRFWVLAASSAAEAMRHSAEEMDADAAEGAAAIDAMERENQDVAAKAAARLNEALVAMADRVDGIVAIEATPDDVTVRHGCLNFSRDKKIGCVLAEDGREFAIPAWAALKIARGDGFFVSALMG